MAYTTARAVHRFLGLAGYYRKFVKEFGTIAAPLTALLKEGFAWTEAASVAFTTLKTAVTTAPILALLDFEQPFIVATHRGVRCLHLWVWRCPPSGPAPCGVLQPSSGATTPVLGGI